MLKLILYEKSSPIAALSSDGAKLFIVSVLLQKNYFAIYWRDFVFTGFNLPKYTSLPHLWHSVITFIAVSQAKQVDLSKSDEKILRSRARCEVANDVTPKHSKMPLSKEGLGTFFHRIIAWRSIYSRSFIENQRNKEKGSLFYDGKRKKMKIKSLDRTLAKKNEIVYISNGNRKNKKNWTMKNRRSRI